MDPELRSFLEAMEQRTNAKMEAVRTDMAAMEQRLSEKIDETRALHEETWKKIDALGEGFPPTSARKPSASWPTASRP